MSELAKLATVNHAYDDLLRRTLSGIPCDLARLIYLASTRDYNSGMYHHEGLSTRYGPGVARVALKGAHKDTFFRLVALSLEQLVTELDTYVRISRETPSGLIHAWQELEPYRVAVPMEVDSTMVQLFLSNIRLALEVLKFRQGQNQACPSASSLRPLLGQ
ncbi:MAG: hypothetical protein WBL63_00310 [Candidatus Acidiferrum sp.]